MSYDLFFKSRSPNSEIDPHAISAYFRQRKHYEVSDKQAVYENKPTGVYFIFDFGEVDDEKCPGLAPVSFNLNYLRPNVFGLEAEPEVRALVQEFNLIVSDPQIGGMGDGDYSTEGFLRGWNEGNEFSYNSLLQPGEKPPLTLPTAKLEACWRWNKSKTELQEKLGDNVFVPRFMYINRGETVLTMLVWPDGIPIALPDADTVLIQRTTILPKRLFFDRSPDKVLAPWSEVEVLVRQFPLEQGSLPFRLLSYPSVPASVVSHLLKFRPTKEELVGVGIDTILNAELVSKVRAK